MEIKRIAKKIPGILLTLSLFLILAPSSSQTASMSFSDVKNELPKPILDDHPEWVNLYWKAWEIACSNVEYGTVKNGFAPAYLDEGYDGRIFQFDAIFMALFTKYGVPTFPSIQSLDNFYSKQHNDGSICSEINESDGTPKQDYPTYWNIRPPLFSWAEWEHYKVTNDKNRLINVLPLLDRFYEAVKTHRQGPDGVYLLPPFNPQPAWPTGMDNLPLDGYYWIDFSSQQALNALSLFRIASAVGNTVLATKYQNEYSTLKNLINQKMWDAQEKMYYNVNEDWSFNKVKTVASFYPMLAEITNEDHVAGLVSHLQNQSEFWRFHVFPTVSADYLDYDPEGSYWSGGVWSPTNYAIIKGLEKNGYEDLAKKAAENHIENMVKVFKDTGSIWEYYAPDRATFGTDSIHPYTSKWTARPDFVGWSGLGPIALLIENVLGFRVDGPADTLRWRLSLTERHGIQGLKFGDNIVDIFCEARSSELEGCYITVTTNSSFTLKVETSFGSFIRFVPSGTTQYILTGYYIVDDFEAEDFHWQNGERMVIVKDSEASSGKYVWAPPGTDNTSDGMLIYDVKTENGGTFGVWARCHWTDHASNSFGIGWNPESDYDGDGKFDKWDLLKAEELEGSDSKFWIGNDAEFGVWQWVKAKTDWNLAEGDHMLILIDREDGAKIDKIRVATLVGDTTPPTTIDDYNNLWHNRSYIIPLEATDDISGVQETYYRINDEPVKRLKVDGHPSITTEGAENKLEYWSVDIADNEELPHNILTKIKLDKTSPTIFIDSPRNNSEIRSSSLTITWTGNDSVSDIDYYEIILDQGSWIPKKEDTIHKFTRLIDGSHTLTIRAVDKAGNSQETSIVFSVNTSFIGGPGYFEETALVLSTIVALGTTLYLLKKKRRR